MALRVEFWTSSFTRREFSCSLLTELITRPRGRWCRWDCFWNEMSCQGWLWVNGWATWCSNLVHHLIFSTNKHWAVYCNPLRGCHFLVLLHYKLMYARDIWAPTHKQANQSPNTAFTTWRFIPFDHWRSGTEISEKQPPKPVGMCIPCTRVWTRYE